tara:strand:+ start:658 stop:882 length:225 start_codon:yes stop_codon:yes gene_type:complete
MKIKNDNIYYMFKHPKEVCMSYLEHCMLSLNFSYILLVGSMKALIHAIYPDAYVTSTSDLLVDIEKKMEKAGCH